MCGRTAQGLASAQIRQQLDKTLPSKPRDFWIDEEKYRTSYNVAPTRYQPVVRADPKTNSYVVHLMRWGLIPRHTKSMPDYSSVLKSINARDDSLFMGPTGKAMFNHSKNHKRCILLAEGFYEWRRRGKDRVPFYTKRRDGNLMLMAAIYDVAQIQGSTEPLYTYATITTNASPQLDWLHDRMPVLVPNNDHELIRMWLDPNLKWNTTLEAMLKPCDEFIDIEEPDESCEGAMVIKRVYALETYQVDEKVNNVRNDSPEFAKPWNSSSNKRTLNRFFVPKASSSDAAASLKLFRKMKHGHGTTEHEKSSEFSDSEGDNVHRKPEDKIKSDSLDWEQEQNKVSVLAEDSQRDTGFAQQEKVLSYSAVPDDEGPKDEEEEDSDFRLALELSRQEQTDSTSNMASTRTGYRGTHPNLSSTPTGGSATFCDFPGSVDLLEKRRMQLQEQDEEMKRVLELSLLQAIANGHEDVHAHSDTETPQGGHAHESARREQEELEIAIAASLNDFDNPPELQLPQQSVQSTSSTTTAMGSSASKKTKVSAPLTPRKRKPNVSTPASPLSASKKGRLGQENKITDFFRHAAPP
ncbi:hypothetical protein BC939DRAFT_498239 [Gamsiella multidivaricata]|uniref:uncharacterized protein n=1 Tax=Gamsiella multidivaricata TaxID=101098 RepID=UPI0022209A00|nr:uncharacterized protein BC939DRAFT_498239 [Gamsiella multidivaricata]KAG0365709.1 hypothetical protein BGZ54_006289 [Gamsiella multidivaricata]KAI7832840.1 hypothetical protein BC939DRAFT_498239 [Gamsiella multidivaricata]